MSKTLKILFVKKNLDSMGGSEYQMTALSWGLSEVARVKWWYVKADFSIFPDLEKMENIHEKNKTYASFLSILWIVDFILALRKERPDILYSRDSRRVWLYAILCKVMNIELVWSVNYALSATDFTLLDLRDHLHRISENGKPFPLWAVFSYFNNKLLGIIHPINQTMENNRILNEQGIENLVISNGHIPLEHENVVKKQDPPTIAYVGTLRKSRRPELFLKLAKDLSSRYIDFIMCGRIGHDDEKYNTMLLDLISSTPNVQYVEQVPKSTVESIIEESSLFVDASITAGMSNVFIEAWLRETPLVTYGVDIGQLTGLEEISLSCDSYEELVETVIDLLEDEEKRKRIGKRARQFAEETFSLERIIEQHMAFFGMITNTRIDIPGKNFD